MGAGNYRLAKTHRWTWGEEKRNLSMTDGSHDLMVFPGEKGENKTPSEIGVNVHFLLFWVRSTSSLSLNSSLTSQAPIL